MLLIFSQSDKTFESKFILGSNSTFQRDALRMTTVNKNQLNTGYILLRSVPSVTAICMDNSCAPGPAIYRVHPVVDCSPVDVVACLLDGLMELCGCCWALDYLLGLSLECVPKTFCRVDIRAASW